MVATDENLRYPVGRFTYDPAEAGARRQECIGVIAAGPRAMRTAYEALTPPSRVRSYRPGGWTADQIVHHVADSHANAYIRVKLALTEDVPTIKPYDEAKWAELADSKTVPPEVSLTLLDALHRRWIAILESLRPAEFGRTIYHPERQETMSIDHLLAMYAWHCRHHTAHLRVIASHPV
jgi:hypothetical protein